MEQITSRKNPLLVQIRKLTANRAFRRQCGQFLGDGGKLLEEALKWNAPLTAVVVTEGTATPELPEGVRLVEVPRDVMASVSPMEAPQGVLFLCEQPKMEAPELLPAGKYLVLDGLQEVTAEEVPGLLERSGLPLYATALREDTVDLRQADLSRCAVAIGSEGRGVSPELLTLSQCTLKIPMRTRCESLNAAAAAAVVLWEMAR